MSGTRALAGRPLRCAIYTRADPAERPGYAETVERQREICMAYIRGQPQRNWDEAPERYDDDGSAGVNLKRPQLTRLFGDIERGLVDIVLVTRIDRLTRSLGDLEALIRRFEKNSVRFASVVQPFDSDDSNGQLILDVLRSFAAFESQKSSDRIRASRAAMRLSGKWPGGRVPLGYDVVDGRLAINPAEAETIREVYRLYLEHESCKKVARALGRTHHRTKTWTGRDGKLRGGKKLSAHMIYWLLARRLYLGDIEQGGQSSRGAHDAIIDRETFERAMQLREQNSVPTSKSRVRRSFLLGFLFDESGRRMIIDRRSGNPVEYRYYVSAPAGTDQDQARVRAHADSLEKLVLVGLCAFLRDRFRVSGAVFRTGYYDPLIESLLGKGPEVAQRLETLDRTTLRQVFEKLIARIEVSHETIRMLISCEALLDVLGWDGVGLFRGRSGRRDAPQIHVIELGAKPVRIDGTFSLPIQPRPEGGQCVPRPALVSLIAFAKEIQAAVHANRDLTLEQIALRFDRQPAFLARVLRINYLAPDIVLAILDGREPPQLGRKDLLFSALPMEWAQQRTLLGFPSQGGEGCGAAGEPALVETLDPARQEDLAAEEIQ